MKPRYERRSEPLNVSGVGNGSQACHYDCHLPLAFQTTSGERRTGDFKTPTISDSELPGLLGLNALTANRAVIDCHTNKMYFLGPGDYDLEKAMPPGTDVFQAERAPSGHLVLPCCMYDSRAPNPAPSALSLHTRERPRSTSPPPRDPPILPDSVRPSEPPTGPPSHSAL